MTTMHVYIVTPSGWTAEQFRKWAPTCGTCGTLCNRYRWIGRKVQAFRCAACDALTPAQRRALGGVSP